MSSCAALDQAAFAAYEAGRRGAPSAEAPRTSRFGIPGQQRFEPRVLAEGIPSRVEAQFVNADPRGRFH
jgi:hypothetical protein